MAERTALLKIDGMHCENCAASISSALRSVDGVRDVRIDVDAKQALVVFDAERAGLPKLRRAVAKIGFRAR